MVQSLRRCYKTENRVKKRRAKPLHSRAHGALKNFPSQGMALFSYFWQVLSNFCKMRSCEDALSSY